MLYAQRVLIKKQDGSFLRKTVEGSFCEQLATR